MKFDVVKGALIKGVTKVRKYSPELLLVAGTVAIGAGVYFACKATLKVDDILDEANEKKDRIKSMPISDEYTDQDAKKDLCLTYIQTGAKFAKAYLPAAALVLGGLSCFYGSYGILKRRNIAMTAAYYAVDKAYKAYRDRVKEAVGEEKEKDIYHALTKTKIDEMVTDENGKEKKVKKEVDVWTDYDDPNQHSPYARFFDELSNCWHNNPEQNLAFLKAQQNYATQLLNARGHLFLNEVYDMLDIPRTQAGQVVGWIKGMGDDYVDFGLYDGKRERVRAFVNGYEPSILLDFNVDGPIWDNI